MDFILTGSKISVDMFMASLPGPARIDYEICHIYGNLYGVRSV